MVRMPVEGATRNESSVRHLVDVVGPAVTGEITLSDSNYISKLPPLLVHKQSSTFSLRLGGGPRRPGSGRLLPE
eukprot:3917296-Rhodomonas_salina.1